MIKAVDKVREELQRLGDLKVWPEHIGGRKRVSLRHVIKSLCIP
jgi:hypothetical protein